MVLASGKPGKGMKDVGQGMMIIQTFLCLIFGRVVYEFGKAYRLCANSVRTQTELIAIWNQQPVLWSWASE